MGIPIRRIFKTRKGVLIGTGSAAAALGVSLLYLVGPGANTPDTKNPEVAFTGLRNGSTITGSRTLVARADDNSHSITSIQFKLDGVNLGPVITSPPYQFDWNSGDTFDGTHTISAVATDPSANQGFIVKTIHTSNGVVGGCTPSDVSGCDSVGGTVVNYMNNNVADVGGNANVNCTNSALKDYAFKNYANKSVTGTGWPVHVNIDLTHGSYNWASNPPAPITTGIIRQMDGVYLGNGCTGDNNPNTCDLVYNVYGDGHTFGLQGDLIKANGSTTGPHDIQICGGHWNSGPPFGNIANLPDDSPSATLVSGSDVVTGLVTTGAARATTMPIFGQNGTACDGFIPNNTTIIQILSSTSVRMSAPATNSCTGGVKSGFPIKHTDEFQLQNGQNINVYGTIEGMYSNAEGRHATCECGGGGVFISLAGTHRPTQITLTDMHIDVCNRSFGSSSAQAGDGDVLTNVIGRNGRPDDTTAISSTIDPNAQAQGASDPRVHGLCHTQIASTIVTGYAGVSYVGTIVSDKWAQTGQTWSPGFNPLYDIAG